MKRILIFSLNYYPRFIGGAEVAIKEITDRMPPEEVDFHMVTLRFDSKLPQLERVGNVLVHRIGFARLNASIADLRKFPLHLNKFFFQFMGAVVALRLNRRHRYDGIWAMMAHSCGIPAGIFKFFNPRTPYLLTLQEGDPPEHIEAMMRRVWPLFKRAFTSAEYLQAISTFLLSWGQRMGFKGEGLVIPNAVDVARFSAPVDADARAKLRAEYAGKNDTLLITTSRLVPKNAVDDVIRALAQLPKSVQFLVLGIGPEEDALRALALEQGVAERVHFVGEKKHAELPLYLAASDIFIRPSRSEGMGNSFVEAMAASIPVIATQEGGLSDFIFDSERNPDTEPTAWAVDANSPEQIARAVKRIGTDEAARTKTLANAHRMVEKTYDWNTVADDMQMLMERMLSSR